MLFTTALLLFTYTCSQSVNFPIPTKVIYNSTYQTPFKIPEGKLDKDFLYGYASSAAQVEGAADADGKSPSIWDHFATLKDKIVDGSKPDVTNNEYVMINETITLLKLTGAKAYRFSIAWTRLVPGGREGSKVNQKAVDHYNHLINSLLENNITPLVTLYHWDEPYSLIKHYGGLLDTEKFAADYVYFARTAFKHFGDRIKFWITFNEPFTHCSLGYMDGQHAPGKCMNPRKCHFGLPTEGLRCGHTILVSHAQAVYIYRTEFQPKQKGRISIVNVGQWFYPLDPYSPKDIRAAQRALDLQFGWFVDPLYTGDYNPAMKSVFGIFLPKFSQEQKLMLKGSLDFFGLNHYTSAFATLPSKKLDQSNSHNVINLSLMGFKLTYSRNDSLIGSASQTTWLYNIPQGFEDLLVYVARRYGNPEIYVMENGFAVRGEPFMALRYAIKDKARVEYYEGYISAMLRAIKSGVNVRAYISWTLTDNWEWAEGFTNTFGVVFVERPSMKRVIKWSGYYLRDVFAKLIPQ